MVTASDACATSVAARARARWTSSSAPPRSRWHVLAVTGAERLSGEADLVHARHEIGLLGAGELEHGEVNGSGCGSGGGVDDGLDGAPDVAPAPCLGGGDLDPLEDLVVTVHSPAETVLSASPHPSAERIRPT
jgi:hypothetical protein